LKIMNFQKIKNKLDKASNIYKFSK